LRLSSFGGYGWALAALAIVVFGAYDSYQKHYWSGCRESNTQKFGRSREIVDVAKRKPETAAGQ